MYVYNTNTLILLLCCIITADTYIINIEQARPCDNVRNRIMMDVIYNYSTVTNTGHGYFEMLTRMTWEDNLQLTIDTYQKSNNDWTKSHFNTPKSGLCVSLFTDVIFSPLVRSVLNVDAKCPIKKGRIEVKTSKIASKYNSHMPYGCYMYNATVENSITKHAESICVYTTVYTSRALKLNRTSCI